MHAKLTIPVDLYKQMSTVEKESSRTEDEKLSLLKEAKMGTWYDGWKPYCVSDKCKRMPRMDRKAHGFTCPACGNIIGWNLCRLQESPTNYK